MKIDDARVRVDFDLRTRAGQTDQAQAEREQRLKARMPDMKGVDVQRWGWAIIATGGVFAGVLTPLAMLLGEWVWAGSPQWFRVGQAVPIVVGAVALVRTRLGLWLASRFYHAWTPRK